MDRNAMLARRVGQVAEEARAIVVIDEDRNAIVAALNNVQNGTIEPEARLARH